MGNKFCDNSRYLFQYLSANKEKYGISKVVWVTRNPDVYKIMRDSDYTVYMMKSKDSIYYHFKAGFHVICNMYASAGIYKGDLIGNLSWNAIKIQLWHGVGIKACSGLTNQALNNANLREKRVLFKSKLFQPGGWKSDGYFLATSPENKRVAIYDYQYNAERIIISVYPRLCKCPHLMQDEINELTRIADLKNAGNKIILYLPTFRNNNEYVEPINIPNFESFLEDNHYIWIEKRHSADIRKDFCSNNHNIISLENDFDINVLYEYMDLVISDYSSAISDATYHGVLTLDYCPDYDEYKGRDRGFVAPFGKYHLDDYPIVNPNDLLPSIKKRIEDMELYKSDIDRLKKYLFADYEPNYEVLMHAILEKTKRKQ